MISDDSDETRCFCGLDDPKTVRTKLKGLQGCNEKSSTLKIEGQNDLECDTTTKVERLRATKCIWCQFYDVDGILSRTKIYPNLEQPKEGGRVEDALPNLIERRPLLMIPEELQETVRETAIALMRS